MRSKFALPLFLAMVGAQAASAQGVKDPATLMPSKAMAYAEIRHIDKLAKEIGLLFQGSALGDVPDSFDKELEKLHTKYSKIKELQPYIESRSLGGRGQGMGAIGMMFSPELLAEIGRVQGAAIALTGVDLKRREPEFIAVVLPGQSNAPAFLMRLMLTVAPVRKIESIEGVSLYGIEYHIRIRKPEKPQKPGEPPQKPVYEDIVEHGPSFAMAPGALFIGSHDNVKEAVLRLKGKLKTPSLAQNPTFQEARKSTEDKPGLFGFGNTMLLMQLLDKAQGNFRGPDREIAAMILKTVNPAAFRAVAKSVSLDQGKLTVRQTVFLDPKETSPFLELVPTKAVDLKLLHFAPNNAVIAAAIDNSDGEERFKKYVALVDSFLPNDFRFSDLVKNFERELGASLGKDVFGQVVSVGFALGDPLQVKVKHIEEIGPDYTRLYTRHEMPPMVFLVQAASDKAAEDLFALVPKFFIHGGVKDKSTRTVDGREIAVLKLGGEEEFCYGRQGSTLVISNHAGTVAACLIAGTKKQGLLANPQVVAHLNSVNGRQAVAFMKPVHLISSFAMAIGGSVSSKKVESRPDFPDKEPKKEPKKKETKVTYSSPMDDPLIKQLSEILSTEEFHVVSLLHTKEKLQIDGHAAGLRPLVAQLTDLGVEAMYYQQLQQMKRWEDMRREREKAEKTFPK